MRYRWLGSTVEPAKRQREDADWSVTVWDGGGLTVRLHFTFLLLLAWLGYHAFQDTNAFAGSIFLLGALFSFAFHDLAHVLLARWKGCSIRELVIYPLGGAPSFEGSIKPKEEFWVSLAGPVASALLGAILLWVCAHLGPVRPFDVLLRQPGYWLEKTMFLNLTLAVLNLFPGYPADGGRILHALLTPKLGQSAAAAVPGAFGHGAGMLAGLYATLGHPHLLFFTVFMLLGATAELGFTRHRELVEGATAEDAMITDFVSLSPADTLGRAAEILLRGSQPDFPVVHDGELHGMLSREDLLKGLAREGRLGYVAGSMRRNFAIAKPTTELHEVIALFDEQNVNVLPILHNGRLVGIITPENVGEFIALRRHSPTLSEG